MNEPGHFALAKQKERSKWDAQQEVSCHFTIARRHFPWFLDFLLIEDSSQQEN